MESQSNQPDLMTALDQAKSPTLQEAAEVASSQNVRLNRVLDYQVSSPKKDDPLEAKLGSINSGLMLVALCLDETIAKAMKGGLSNVERLSRILPALEAHLRVTRQIDRFAQSELRAAESRKPKPWRSRAKFECSLDTLKLAKARILNLDTHV